MVKTRQKGNSGQAVISFGIIGMVIGGLLSTPMLIAEKNWRDALEIGSLPRIEKTLEAFPRNSNRYILGIKILTNNNLDNEALKYVKELNEFDSNNFVGWDYLMNVRLASPQDKERALKEMKRLDPNRKFD